MIYFSDKELDDLLLEDIYRGDLTTHALGIENIPAKILFKRKNAGIVAGVSVAEKLLKKLDIQPHLYVKEGEGVESCGVAQYTAEMIANAKAVNPSAVVACTRKSITNTRKLATNAVLAAGGHIHRQGISETLLIFTNHRNLLSDPNDWVKIMDRLRQEAPENKITLEADNYAQFEQMYVAEPDIIQLDKWSLEDVKKALDILYSKQKDILLSVAGGVNKNNVSDYAKLGIRLFITSAPYYAPPEDIKVVIEKI